MKNTQDYFLKIREAVRAILEIRGLHHISIEDFDDFETLLKGDISELNHLEKQLLYTYNQMLITKDYNDKEVNFYIEYVSNGETE